jgi:hypothetical protein
MVLGLSVLILVSYMGYPHALQTFQLSPSPSYDTSSEFRRLLNDVNPLDRFPHSKTLGVASRLHMIGLPHREDRRMIMQKLGHAMGRSTCFALIYCLAKIESITTRYHIYMARGYAA